MTLTVRVQPRASRDALGGRARGRPRGAAHRPARGGRGQRGARPLPGQDPGRRAIRRAHASAAPRAATRSWRWPGSTRRRSGRGSASAPPARDRVRGRERASARRLRGSPHRPSRHPGRTGAAHRRRPCATSACARTRRWRRRGAESSGWVPTASSRNRSSSGPRRPCSTPAGLRSCPASSTPTPTSPSRATATRRSASAWPGATYQQIAAAGGGIVRTVEATRSATPEDLEQAIASRLDEMLLCGTTTAEVKSGYGLETAAELRSLEAIRGAASRHPVTVVPTFLGAHEVPREHRADRGRYVDLLLERDDPGGCASAAWPSSATSSASRACSRSARAGASCRRRAITG